MRQYFIDKAIQIGDTVTLSEEISHHLKNVLRAKEGETVRLVDTHSKVFLASLVLSDPLSAVVREEVDIVHHEFGPIVFCASLIKRDKWELLLQKATELGANRIVPVISERTIIRLEEKEIRKKVERWNKIVLEAAQQCNRTDLCVVEAPVRLKDVIRYKSDVNLIAYENETDHYVSQYLDEGSITFLTGPEGGLTIEEVEYLKANGFISCSLGERILRAETAGMYFLTAIDVMRNSR